MPQYKYSRDDYYRLTNASCLDVARALGMEINEKESDRKSWKIKGEQGLCIYREGNGWYRFSDGQHGFPIDLVKDKLCCSTEQALDFIARYVVNGVSEQVNIPRRTALSEPEKPREFSPPAHDILPKRVMDAAHLSFDCDIMSHLQAFFFRKFSLRTLYGRNRVTTSLYLTPHRQRRCRILPGLKNRAAVLFSRRINIRPITTGCISRRFGFRTGKTTPSTSRFSTCGVRLVSFR